MKKRYLLGILLLICALLLAACADAQPEPEWLEITSHTIQYVYPGDYDRVQPVFLMTSMEDLAVYRAEAETAANKERLLEFLDGYTEEYFEDNILIAAFVSNGGGGVEDSLKGVWLDGTEAVVVIEHKLPPPNVGGPAVIVPLRFFAETKRGEIASVRRETITVQG